MTQVIFSIYGYSLCQLLANAAIAASRVAS
jgi:hypothetical protein